jgi:hypothetical protein
MSLRPTHFERAAKKSVGTALLMTTNNELIDQFARAYREIDVSTVSTSLVRDSLELIHGRKFEAFVIDTGLDNPHLDLLSEVRSSSSNSTAVMVVVAPPGPMVETARKAGANFVLEEPLTYEAISRTLRASYGMIVRECRRYFRCPLRIPIIVTSSVSGEIRGETIDVSEEGMALRVDYLLGVGTELIVKFKLPGLVKDMVARAEMVRNGDGGVAGIRFVDLSTTSKGQLHEWLSHRLEEKIPSLAKQSA